MRCSWILVVAVAISGISRPYVIDAAKNDELDQEQANLQSKYSKNAEVLSEEKFNCQNKPSGYYADPRFNCKVFHFCHEDGTRVTIPCSQSSSKHRVCLFKDIISTACEGSEIYLALPEDQSQIKSSKDTTASAFNDATEFKLPRVLSQPSSSSKKQSTTPLSFDEHKNEKTNSLLTQGIGGIYEVFNSVLKEINSEEKSQPDSHDSSMLKLSPATFSRGSRVHASLEKRNGLLNTSPELERRSDENGAYLVEVYNKDLGNVNENDYSSYRRKSKKLFFASSSDKKTPSKHPRRRKRMTLEQLNVQRPYAVIYTKFPDFTFASDARAPRKFPRQRQDVLDLPFAPAIVPADTPTIPITIETRRKKKSKSKKKPKQPPNNGETVTTDPLEGQEETAEQQNVLFYAPNQGLPIRQPNGEGFPAVNGQNRNPENQRLPQRERPRQSSLQQVARPQIESQSNTRAPYSPPQGNPLQLPTFPFQPQFLNNPPQTSFYFGPQDLLQNGGFPSFGPHLPEHVQGQPQQNNSPVQFQTQPDQSNNPVQYQTQPQLANNSPEYQGQQQTRNNPPQQSTQSQTPQRQPHALENIDNGRPEGNFDRNPDHTRSRQQRPQVPTGPQIPGFHNAFLEGFPGFDSLSFNGPFVQHDPNVFNIPPISQPELQSSQPQVPRQRQSPHINQDRPVEVSQGDNQQRRPIQNNNRPQQTNSLPAPYSLQAIGDPNQFVREILERERTRNENPEILVPVRTSQRPPRTRGRPSPPSEQPVSRKPERQRDRIRPNPNDEQQTAKNPVESRKPIRESHIPEQNQAQRRPQNDSPYIPPELVVQPEIVSNLPVRNAISNEYVPNIPSRPDALAYDLTYQNQPTSTNVQNRPIEIVYSQREPSGQRLRPQISTQPERERRPTEPQVYSTNNYSPTTFSPSLQRTRNPDRYPSRTAYTSRPRPTEEPTRNIEERPPYRYRTTPAHREGSSNIRTRPSSTRQQYPEESPVTNRYYTTSSPRYRPSLHSEDNPYQVHSSYPEQVQRPRSRPQAQIERPPSEYTNVKPVAERPTYSRPQDSFSYPPQGNPNYNDVNVISTIDDSDERFGTPQPSVRRPGYRGTASNTRYPNQNPDSEVKNGFLPLTETPVKENSYHGRDPTTGYRNPEYQPPRNEKPYRNRYQEFDEEITSTREVTTTTRPTTKRRPPPPRPTFPSFPTFPPPPKRPITTPKPRTTSEPIELKEEVKESDGYLAESDATYKSTEGRAPYVETYNSPKISKSNELITEKYLYTEEPEVTTRRRTRKRRPKPRRPRPSTSAPEEDLSYIDLSTKAPAERETSTKSASERYNIRKVTAQPRRTTSTSSTTEIQASASSVKNEEYGSRINLFGKPRTRKPAVFQNKFTTTTVTPSKQEPQLYTKVTTSTRTRRPYTRRTRPKSTTTTTEPSDVTEPIARQDEEAESSNLSWRGATDIAPLQESESITQMSVDTVPNDIQTTEPYNELPETTEVPDTTTTKNFDESESSTETKDKVENFESTRSVMKKFQNRPRVLKFGKPKLRTTEPPLDLNVAASIRRA